MTGPLICARCGVRKLTGKGATPYCSQCRPIVYDGSNGERLCITCGRIKPNSEFNEKRTKTRCNACLALADGYAAKLKALRVKTDREDLTAIPRNESLSLLDKHFQAPAQLDEKFLCVRFACTLTAEACVKRQKCSQEWESGATHLECAKCPQGERVQEALGKATVDAVKAIGPWTTKLKRAQAAKARKKWMQTHNVLPE